MCGVFAIFDSVPSFTKRLLRASRRAKRRLKTVLRKFLTFFYIYINAIIICKLTILYWFTSIYESYYSYRVHWRIVQGQKDLKLIIERLWASLSAVLPTKPTFFCLLSVRRFSIQPVCGDLQSQILKCYKENTGKTLSCSSIASAYMQCVDNAKKVPLNI